MMLVCGTGRSAPNSLPLRSKDILDLNTSELGLTAIETEESEGFVTHSRFFVPIYLYTRVIMVLHRRGNHECITIFTRPNTRPHVLCGILP